MEPEEINKEYTLQNRLQHPNIVEVYELTEDRQNQEDQKILKVV
jgi:hypothetical protein